MNLIETKQLSEESWGILADSFTKKDVEEAIKGMHPTKAPGPDGYQAEFYQKFWNIVGNDVSDLALDFLNKGRDIADINKTFITLIPKVNDPEMVKDFRPIALCNVIYKVITKALANRLRLVMEDVIDEAQSAFVKGRLITDNATIAHEVFHWMKCRSGEGKKHMALKLDMHKAYDRVEWQFLQEMMGKMNFPEGFINRVMDCIKSVSMQVLINGEPSSEIKPTRGIRQGNPLVPFYFSSASKDFQHLLEKPLNRNGFKAYQSVEEAQASLTFCLQTTA